MTDETTYHCEACGDPVDPDDPAVVSAFPQEDVSGFGGRSEFADGVPVLFHEHHFPSGGRHYRIDK